jgi:hypothetical protein
MFMVDLAFVVCPAILLFEKEPGRWLVGYEHVKIARSDAGAHDWMFRAREQIGRNRRKAEVPSFHVEQRFRRTRTAEAA